MEFSKHKVCETMISATEKKNQGRQKDRMPPYWDEIEILNGGVKEDLIEKVRCEKNPERDVELSYMVIWRKTQRCQGLRWDCALGLQKMCVEQREGERG